MISSPLQRAKETTARRKPRQGLFSPGEMPLQRLDGAFQVNAARAFHENHIAGAKILLEPLAGSLGIPPES